MSLSQRLQNKNNSGDLENINLPDSKPVPEEKVDKYAALKMKIHKEVIERILESSYPEESSGAEKLLKKYAPRLNNFFHKAKTAFLSTERCFLLK